MKVHVRRLGDDSEAINHTLPSDYMTAESSLLATMMSSRFEEPFDMLTACHRRVLSMLDLLERLGDHLDQIGADAPARQAARDLMRFFDLAAAHHHNDEELHLLPKLRRLGSDVLAQEVLNQHRTLARDWSQIRGGLSKLSVHADELHEGLSVRRANWHRFAKDYRAHIALEEREIFPAIKESILSVERHEIGVETSHRR